MFDATVLGMTSVADLRAAVVRCATGFDAAVLDPDVAAEAVGHWAAIEHAAATAKAHAAQRVATASTWRASGAPSAADWLARTTGTTAARAREQLTTASQLRALPDTDAAARRGDVSPDQVAAVAAAASADPDAESSLLDAASKESLGELRQRCARTRAAADRDPDATRRRIHRQRSLRRWAGADGAHHLHATGPAELLARVDAAIRPLADDAFQRARTSDDRESPEAYAFDALVALADQPAADRPSRRVRYRGVLRVDLEALVRGSIEGDETCEIAGLGPIPVAIARSLLGEATLHLVLTKGTDVANVTYLGRGPSAAQRIALLWQMPRCSRLGCNRQARLQVDHRTPFAKRRVTELGNLDPLCEHDHRLKTTSGWSLVEGTGCRPMVPPDHPDHPAAPARASPSVA